MKTKQLASTVVGLSLLVGSGAVMAGTVGGSLGVSATVAESCTITSVVPLAFGTSVNPISATPTDTTGTINVQCTNGAAGDIYLDEGLGASASIATRKLTGSGSADGSTLDYTLYSDAGRTEVWGETTGDDAVVLSGTGNIVPYTVYGRIFGSQSSAEVGPYADTVTITVNF